jgi:GNAT superfamily N-acetyltransferase
MSENLTIRALSPDEADAAVPALADILLDCVAGGASIGFMADVTRERAEAFWRAVARGVREEGRILLVAETSGGEAVGTVQLIPCLIDNQPHRADVAKMLVKRSARNMGLGAALMAAIEAEARRIGRSVLVLDTVTGAAGDRLYRRMGWTHVGDIPDYAFFPDGRLTPTSLFFKRL